MRALTLCSKALGLALSLISVMAACSSRGATPREGDACSGIEECAATIGLSCRDGVCAREACERTLECAAGAACVEGECGGAECLQGADCAPQEVCFEGDCRQDLCGSREACPEGEVCLGTPPQCQAPPPRCAGDEECPAGLACKLASGRCAPACSPVAECPQRAWCDGSVCRASCQAQSECDVPERCIQGLCRAPLDCSDAPPCPAQALPLRDPFSCLCVACLSDQDCLVTRGESCVESQCVRCQGSSVGEGGGCNEQGLRTLTERCCVGCLSEGDCEAGSVCERGECLDTRSRPCQEDAECPEPFECDGRFCASAASLTGCALQSDCPSDEACYGDGRCRQQAMTCLVGCEAPSRCIAAVDAPVTAGVCVGCQEDCSQQGCPAQTRCHLPEGQGQGWCVGLDLFSELCSE